MNPTSPDKKIFGLAPAKSAEMLFSIMVLGMVVLLFMPVPAFVLDLLISFSITVSVVVLLVTLYTTNPLHFSSFPGLLLILTLFRIALNLRSTVMILSSGQAGHIIQAFGTFVVKGDFIVGLVLFLLLLIVNFMVVSKGATRIAEVAARFTLDAMPGHQMAIDQDLANGVIDEIEAQRRRDDLIRKADFYGSMDGASKYVRGDAMASLITTFVNLLGGFAIGVMKRGMTFSDAMHTYSILTIGDGLITQIPAFLVSVAAGIIVAQASSRTHMGEAVIGQLTRHPRVLQLASVLLVIMGLVPGFPILPFWALAGGCFWLARRIKIAPIFREETARVPELKRAPEGTPEAVLENMPSEPIQIPAFELQVGHDLVSFCDASKQGDITDRLQLIRKSLLQEIGVMVPPVRIRDNLDLESTEYAMLVRGIEVTRGDVQPFSLLALDTGDVVKKIAGFETVDPFGTPAVWIDDSQRVDAETQGYVVVEPQTVLATHVQETIKQHAHEILGRQDVQNLVKEIEAAYPALVKDVIPNPLSLGTLHRVLQQLLKEGIPIVDMVTILESLADVANKTTDPEPLTEYVRAALSRVIGKLYDDGEGRVRCVRIGPRLEQLLLRFFSPQNKAGDGGALLPDSLLASFEKLKSDVIRNRLDGRYPPVVTEPALRVGVRRLLENALPQVHVLSRIEIPPHMSFAEVALWEIN